MIVFYFFSPRITRSVVYGPRPRNTLDLYLPRHHLRDLQDPVPVVIYLTGAPPGSRQLRWSPLGGKYGASTWLAPVFETASEQAGPAVAQAGRGSSATRPGAPCWPAASAATASSCAAWTTATSRRRAFHDCCRSEVAL